MAKDFNNTGHKNIELLRFYINKDLRRIDKKITANNDNFLGYFFASLIDILIVLVFDDYLTCVPILCRICFIVLLIVVFKIVSVLYKLITNSWRRRRGELGKDRYLSENIQAVIDDFDNIACDGLLICENYSQRYMETEKVYLRDFYLYEIIHHLDKALRICDKICIDSDIYVSSRHDGLIDVYRLRNFLSFSREINNFLEEQTKDIKLEDGLQVKLKDLCTMLDRIKNKI